MSEFGYQSNGAGGIPATYTKTKEVLYDLVAGNNVIPHGVTGTISTITAKNSSNRTEEFSDFRFDGTNIYVNSPTILPAITFVVMYN